MKRTNFAIVSAVALLIVGGSLVLLTLTPVEGQDQPPPEVFTPVDASGWVDPLLPDDAILRSRPVAVNFATIGLVTPSDPHAAVPAVPIRFNLFDDVSMTVVFNKAKPRYDIQIPENPFDLLGQEFEPVGYTWTGDIVGEYQGHVSLVTRGNVCAANISVTGAGSFRIRSLPGGQHAVREINGGGDWECGVVAPEDSSSHGAGAQGGSGCGIDSTGCDDGSVIDIIIFYTSYAREQAGSTAAIEDEIELAIIDTNTAYTNSLVSTQLRLVYQAEIDHPEHCFDLPEVRKPWDGNYDEVHDFRNALRADLVTVMFGKDPNLSCPSLGALMRPESPGFENRAFNTVNWMAAGGPTAYVLAHEAGHNMGCAHQRPGSTGCDGVCDCPTGVCDFSFGYNFPPPYEQALYHTIMASSGTPGRRVGHFSNPDVNYKGFQTGLPLDPPGAEECYSAHNALSIDTTRDTVSNFRQSCDTTDTTTMASFDYFAKQANDPSRSVSLSNNSQYIAFVSDATNFGGQSGFGDIFLYNRESGLVSLVSSHGGGTGGHSSSPVVSGDGRFIGFASAAQNLQSVGANPNGAADIYARDQVQFPFLRRISLSSEEVFAGDNSDSPSISYDGRYIAFESDASNLLDGQNQIADTNIFRDIFVRDRNGNEDLDFDDPGDSETARVSISTGEVQANGDSRAPSISASSIPELDGRYVAFQSDATNLLDGEGQISDTNDFTDIFVHDTAPPGATFRVSVSSSGVQGGGPSSAPSISGDGQRVAFQSDAPNLLDDGSDTNGDTDIFVHQVFPPLTFRVSVSSAGDQADGPSYAPVISPDGRFVAFHSDATNLLGVGVDQNGLTDVFVHDLATGETVRVSINSLGEEATGGPSSSPAISRDGRFIGFESDATNLIGVCVPDESGDCGVFRDIFFRDRGSMCVGDLNGDFVVDPIDLAMLLGSWGSVDPCPPYIKPDLDFDCEVGPGDLAILLGNWGVCL